jgi:hypothetical protein
VSFTVAFGTLAPEESVTEPDSEAVVLLDCAWSIKGKASPIVVIKTVKTMRRNLVILPPEFFTGVPCDLAEYPSELVATPAQSGWEGIQIQREHTFHRGSK